MGAALCGLCTKSESQGARQTSTTGTKDLNSLDTDFHVMSSKWDLNTEFQEPTTRSKPTTLYDTICYESETTDVAHLCCPPTQPINGNDEESPFLKTRASARGKPIEARME